MTDVILLHAAMVAMGRCEASTESGAIASSSSNTEVGTGDTQRQLEEASGNALVGGITDMAAQQSNTGSSMMVEAMVATAQAATVGPSAHRPAHFFGVLCLVFFCIFLYLCIHY